MSQALEQLRRAGLNHSLFRRRRRFAHGGRGLRGRRGRCWYDGGGLLVVVQVAAVAVVVVVVVGDDLDTWQGGGGPRGRRGVGQELLLLLLLLVYHISIIRGQMVGGARQDSLGDDGLAEAAPQAEAAVVVNLVVHVLQVAVVLLLMHVVVFGGGEVEPVLAEVGALGAVTEGVGDVLVGVHQRVDIVGSTHGRLEAVTMSVTSEAAEAAIFHTTALASTPVMVRGRRAQLLPAQGIQKEAVLFQTLLIMMVIVTSVGLLDVAHPVHGVGRRLLPRAEAQHGAHLVVVVVATVVVLVLRDLRRGRSCCRRR